MYQKIFERTGFSPLRSSHKSKNRCCSLCGQNFRPHTVFERYCGHCKKDEELLKFSDWLPEIDEALTARLSA